jgi:hypothetical protein
VSEGITSVLSALGSLNPGFHLMQTLFYILNLEQSSQLLRILLITCNFNFTSLWGIQSLQHIPLPVNRFTLPSIKTSNNYLAARDLILYWLHCPGFSTARSDAALITDSSNALASQFWEGQIRTALNDGPARFLVENTGSTYFDKGFKMLQVLEDNFCPSSISNTFTTLL